MARSPTKQGFEHIAETHVKPTKPLAYNALMASDLTKWAHHAQPQDTVIGDQTTSNPVEQNMSMIGHNVRVQICPLLKSSAECCRSGALFRC